jgi:hypothetical protein
MVQRNARVIVVTIETEGDVIDVIMAAIGIMVAVTRIMVETAVMAEIETMIGDTVVTEMMIDTGLEVQTEETLAETDETTTVLVVTDPEMLINSKYVVRITIFSSDIVGL